MHSFYERIQAAAMRFPDRAAIRWIGDAETTTTYRELLDEAGRITAWLTDRRVERGDRVAILAANDPHWVSTFLAILQCGGVVVPLDTAYSREQVHSILADSGARLAVAGARFVETARAAASLVHGAAPEIVAMPELTAAARDLAPEERRPDGDASDPAVILYTSGTTADPKGVVLTHANLDAERAAVLAVVDANEDDVVLGVLPLFHALAEMANLWLPLTIGATVVFLETVSSSTLLAALDRCGITILACVPQFFYLIHQRVAGEFGRRGRVSRAALRAIIAVNLALRDRLGWNPGRLLFARVHRALGSKMRWLITGGSRFDPAIARNLYGLGISVYNGYGLTETSGAATIVRWGDRFNTSVGPPLPGIEIRIEYGSRLRDQGSGLRDHGSGLTAQGSDSYGDGEIVIRGPIVMKEYYKRPDATAEVLRDGWLHTGDLGRLDDQGRLHITGRKKDVIVLSSG